MWPPTVCIYLKEDFLKYMYIQLLVTVFYDKGSNTNAQTLFHNTNNLTICLYTLFTKLERRRRGKKPMTKQVMFYE